MNHVWASVFWPKVFPRTTIGQGFWLTIRPAIMQKMGHGKKKKSKRLGTYKTKVLMAKDDINVNQERNVKK